MSLFSIIPLTACSSAALHTVCAFLHAAQATLHRAAVAACFTTLYLTHCLPPSPPCCCPPQTVCAFWLRGMCMKGDSCGFLHKFDPERMPVCRVWMKTGECKELECPFKHSLDDVKECNMYKLGFCIYGPNCRYKHTKQPGEA